MYMTYHIKNISNIITNIDKKYEFVAYPIPYPITIGRNNMLKYTGIIISLQ